MKKIMVSQPMAWRSNEQIELEKSAFLQFAKNNNMVAIDSFFKDEFARKDELNGTEVKQMPLHFLAKSIAAMSLCDAVYFAAGWEDARGCRIEHEIAKAYGLEVFYE